MKKVLFITTFVVFIFIPISAYSAIVINEIAWMGTEVEEIESKNWWRYEWLELYNIDGSTSLDGWKIELYRDDLDFTINLTGAIDDYFLITASDKILNYDLNYLNLGGKFNNNGQRVILKNEQGNIIDEINATDDWPAGDNSTKQTMERIGDKWQTSLNSGGTPKAPNSSGATEEPEQEEPTEQEQPKETTTPSTYIPIADAGNDIIGFISQEISFNGASSSDPNGYELAYSWNMGDGKLIEKPSFTYKYLYPGTYLVTLMVYNGRNYAWDTITVKIQNQEITISEFIPNPIGSDNEEWIEIYNKSDSIIDISNWQLDDEVSGSQPFTFPQNTLIAPKNYLVFSKKITGITLDNDKDNVRLLLPEGIVFQEVSYEDCKQGQSSALINEEFIWSVPTPGIANINTIESIGGPGGEIAYQGEPIKQTTKELPQKLITEYIPPAQESTFADPLIEETEEDTNDDLAMVEPLLTQAENEKSNQSILNLILMIIAVILAGLIIGLFLTKLSKKFP